jgi:hypothetical protein
MIASSRQTRRRIGLILASFLLAALLFLTLLQDESASNFLDELKIAESELKSGHNSILQVKLNVPEINNKDLVHLVVVACEGNSKNAVAEAHNMIKSALLLSIKPKIKVFFSWSIFSKVWFGISNS